MTLEEAGVELAAACPWMSDADRAAVLDPNKLPGELEDLVASWQSQGIPARGPSSLETILQVAGDVVQVGEAALPVVGVITKILNLVGA